LPIIDRFLKFFLLAHSADNCNNVILKIDH